MLQCRLDRILVNRSWSDLFPNEIVHYLQFEGSKHRPIFSISNLISSLPFNLIFSKQC